MDLAQRNELLHFLKNPKRLKNVIKRARNVSREVSYNDVKYNLTDKIVGEIFFFGSRLMEMSHKQSDIDVFISIGKLLCENYSVYCEIPILRWYLLDYLGSYI